LLTAGASPPPPGGPFVSEHVTTTMNNQKLPKKHSSRRKDKSKRDGPLFFDGGRGWAISKENSYTAKTAEKDSYKGSHGEKTE